MKEKRQHKYKVWSQKLTKPSKFSLSNPKRYWLTYSASILVLLLLFQWFYPTTVTITGYTKLIKQEALVRSKVSGRITDSFVNNHQYLKKNQVIFQVDCIKVDQKIQSQDTQIQQYEKQIEHLLRDGGLHVNGSDSIKANDRNTQLQFLKAKIQELTQSNQQLQLEKQQYYSTAPISGTLYWLKSINRADFILSGEVIATISGQDSLVSIYKINRKQLNRLRLDKKIEIRTLNGKQEQVLQYGLISTIEPFKDGSAYWITCNYLRPYPMGKFQKRVIGYFPTKSRFPFLFNY